MDNEILQDVRNGKERPWREKKQRGLNLAESMHRLEMHKKANRVWWCSSTLGFLKEIETGEKKLNDAVFCRERLCPMCQWRRSLKVFHEVSRVMDEIERRNENLVPLFLTLTLKNCIGELLSDTLDQVFQGWTLLWKQRKIERIGKGWFRALEVTYNKHDDTFHPHIHAIIFVDKGYFKKNNKDYMQTIDWVKMWRTAVKLDYDPICDIRKVEKGNGKYKNVAEVTKYTLKDTDFIFDGDDVLTDKVVGVLSNSLKNRRLYAFGGILKKIAKELKADKLDQGDLIHVDEEKIREDIVTVLEVYRWNFGFANYVRD